LIRPSSGRIAIGGQPFSRDERGLLRGIGALVESPALYDHLTGEQNLEVTRRLLGVPPAFIVETLDSFGLANDARRRVSSYSAGMRQLLGLALAWLGRPSLLLLDEPTNSLDPAATRRFRVLVRQAAEQNAVSRCLSRATC
jgi:ABC-2 type transport system ATP-binding protein